MKIKLLMSVLLLAAVFGMAGVEASTIAYYRFEDDPGFLVDSGPNGYDLTNPGGYAQVVTTAANPVPQTGQANAKAVDVPNAGYAMVGTTSIGTEDVTVEAFINSDSFGSNPAGIIARTMSGGDSEGWSFQVRQDQYLSSPDNCLWVYMMTSAGARSFFPTGAEWTQTTGDDYYVAAVYVDSGATENITFYQKNLTLGTPMLTGTFGPDGASNFTRVQGTQIWIGATPNGSVPFDGRIDEVRLSSGALSESELLIIPEPSVLVMLAAGGLLFLRRRLA